MVTDGGMAHPGGGAAADDEHAIDIEAGLPPMGEGGCPVCMEPAEWVAVGPCGHREVCANCAVRMRFFDRNWHCCICRAFCPTMVITARKAAGSGSARAGGQQPQGSAAFSAPPLAAGGAGQVGMYLSYHSGVAAYFDSPEQYEKATKLCLRLPPPSSSSLHDHAAPAPSDQDAPPDDDTWVFLLILVVGSVIIGGLFTGLPVALHLHLQHWHHRILVVLAFGFLYGVLAYLGSVWIWNKLDSLDA